MTEQEKLAKFKNMLDKGTITQEQYELLVGRMDSTAPKQDIDLSDTTLEEIENMIYETMIPAKKSSSKWTSKRIRIVVAIIIAVLIIGCAVTIGLKRIAEKNQVEDLKYQMGVNAFMMAINTDNTEYSDEYTIQRISDMTNNVWHDAIYNTPDDESYEYVKGIDSFDEALDRLFATVEIQEFFDDAIPPIIDFSDCPEELVETRDAYNEMLKAYLDLLYWVKAPNASYNTYMTITNEKYKAFCDAFFDFVSLCPMDEIKKEFDATNHDYETEDELIDFK